MTNLIEQLADLVGFHRSYVNCFNDNVPANEQARTALLRAMGYDLSCEQAIQASIDELNASSWVSMLAPCYIAKLEESTHNITISLPDASRDESLDIMITTESGQQVNLTASLSSLSVVDKGIVKGKAFSKYALSIPSQPKGYHTIEISYDGAKQKCSLIFAPKTCYSPQEANTEKMWGYAAQLYSLKSESNFGMGDFGDLMSLVNMAATQKASAIGLNPLHPLYQNNPAHRSPYSPTSRCFLNAMYINVQSVPYFDNCTEAQTLFNSQAFQDQLNYTKDCELIDYSSVASLKYPLIELLYQAFCQHNEPKLKNEFEQFKQESGEDLLQLATFEALYEHFRQVDEHAYGWPKWPSEYQQPDSVEVSQFKKDHAQRIDYFCYVQWLAHRQLKQVADQASAQGMPVGLYLDLAVGCDGSGVDVWSDKAVYVAGAAVGAPPDAMNVLGQDWGLTPINPVALQQQGYLPLVKALRSNMQYAGALRIDHILGLMRQYWVAPGMAADQGIYITFPFEDILRIIALESRRNECVVIGEDLGTVPEGFGEIMASAGLLSYKVLFFERWESGFYKRPELYPAQSMVTVSTHDLPTLSGWWTGRDLVWRQQLNLYPNDEMGQAERDGRVEERNLLIAALDDCQLIAENDKPSTAPAAMNNALSIAVQKFLALADSHIQLIPLEDALEVNEQVNIPGTIDQHPNWRQKLPVKVTDMENNPKIITLANVMANARPRTTKKH